MKFFGFTEIEIPECNPVLAAAVVAENVGDDVGEFVGCDILLQISHLDDARRYPRERVLVEHDAELLQVLGDARFA